METTTITRTGGSRELLSGAFSCVATPLESASFETRMGCGESQLIRPSRTAQDPTTRSYPWIDAEFESLTADLETQAGLPGQTGQAEENDPTYMGSASFGSAHTVASDLAEDSTGPSNMATSPFADEPMFGCEKQNQAKWAGIPQGVGS